MDVPGSMRPPAANGQNGQGSSSTTSSASGTSGASAPGGAAAARATPTVPFATLLAAARGRLGAAMLARPAGARTAAGGRGGSLRASLGGAKPEGSRIESAVHGKKRGQGEPSDGEPDADGTDGLDADGDGGGDGGHGARRSDRAEIDWLDPAARHAAQLAPPGLVPASVEMVTAASANEPVRARSLEELLPALVRRIAWAGDRNKGTVHLELGAGAYAGTTVTVHADAGRVRVEIGGTEGPELDRLRARLDARLRTHGLDVESVT